MTPSKHSAGLPVGGPRVAVVGAGSADAQTLETAEAVGRGLGAAKTLLICGGREPSDRPLGASEGKHP